MGNYGHYWSLLLLLALFLVIQGLKSHQDNPYSRLVALNQMGWRLTIFHDDLSVMTRSQNLSKPHSQQIPTFRCGRRVREDSDLFRINCWPRSQLSEAKYEGNKGKQS